MSTLPPSTPPLAKAGNLAIIWRFVRRYPVQLSLAMIALLVASGAQLAIPRAFQAVVDKGFGAKDPSAINIYFIALIGIVTVMAIAAAVRFYFVTWIGERVVADVRTAVHSHLLTLSPEFFEENRPAEIAARLTADTTIIEQVVGTSASVAIRNLLTAVGGLALLFTTSPKHAALLLLVIPLTVGPIILLGRRVRTLSRSSQDRVADVGAMADEVMGAIRIVQAYTQEQNEARRFGRAVDAAFAAAKRRFFWRAIMTAIVIFLISFAITAVLWEGAQDVIAGRVSGGTITAFVLWSALVAGAFGALTEVYGDVMRAIGAAGRLADLLATQPKISAPARPLAMPEPAAGAIRFESVRFAYPTKPGQSALHSLSFKADAGQTVAIVGPSGAGKSTIFQLIQRFYDPQDGRVLMDGIDVRLADQREVRARLSVVPQETMIFAASALDNIRYGRPTASEDEVWAAADAAHALGFLKELPGGLNTYLGEGGTRLSGGQRQRIAIARAVLRNAPLLLLDEATSALDTESERAVQAALDRLMVGRTTLVIAHRLSTVVRADKIIVMDEGRIVAEGAHDQLIAAGGLYARLAALQFGETAA